MNFWSVAICRTQDGTLEKIDDHKFVAHLLQQHSLTSSDDLAQKGENWTFILNKAHGANVETQALHHALWACFGVSGDFNMYLTPPEAQGLAPHVDSHDVFVVQQAGEKTWTLLEADKRRVLKNITLVPGDVLYLPQGVPHYARSAGNGSSLHVTMSVYRGHFTFAGLLAAWLEVDDTVAGVFDQSLASKIDASQAILAKQGLEKANQPLPPSTLPLLRAFDAHDVPDGLAKATMEQAVLLAKELAESLYQGNDPESMKVAVRLEKLWETQDAERVESFIHAVFASRGLRWIKHYRLYGPKKRRAAVGVQSSSVLKRAFGAFCLDARTRTFCQLMGFPLNH